MAKKTLLINDVPNGVRVVTLGVRPIAGAVEEKAIGESADGCSLSGRILVIGESLDGYRTEIMVEDGTPVRRESIVERIQRRLRRA